MNRKLLVIAFGLAFLCLASAVQAERVNLPQGISFEVPEGWLVIEGEQLAFLNSLSREVMATAAGVPAGELDMNYVYAAISTVSEPYPESLAVIVYAEDFSVFGIKYKDYFSLDKSGLERATNEYVERHRALLDLAGMQIIDMQPMRHETISGLPALFIGYTRTDPVSGAYYEDNQYNFLINGQMICLAVSRPVQAIEGRRSGFDLIRDSIRITGQ